MRTILNNIVNKTIAITNPTTSGVLKEFEKTVAKLHAVSRFQKMKAKTHSDTAAKLQAQVALQVSKTNVALDEAYMAEAAANRINKLLVG